MLLTTLTALLTIFSAAWGCSPRTTNDGIICVCNSTFCDTIPSLGEVTDTLKIFYTSANEAGFNVKEAAYADAVDDAARTITITNDNLQKMIGFGGAFTDSTGSNINKLPKEVGQKLLASYFSDDGIGYNLMRVPIGACNFSPRLYTLDDTENNQEDRDLANFALQEEDLTLKIPIIKQALELRGDKQLNIFGSAWTAPLWMKDKQVWRGGSMLKKENYQAWADYHIKFMDAYLENGIKFWGLTVGNEPQTGFSSTTAIPSMGWDIVGQSDYIVGNLGPTIRNSETYKNLKIMILDESLNVLPFMVPPMLANDSVLEYTDGVACHWYQDTSMDPKVRQLAHTDKKDIFVLESETCHSNTQPILGSWDRAADYLENIITDIQYGYAGWVEWNLALNTTGGPTQIDWPADAPIIISDDATEFYKNPVFYILGHFSKHVLPGSVRVKVENENDPVRTLAFIRPDNLKVVIMYNSAIDDAVVQLNDGDVLSEALTLPSRSVSTVVYNPTTRTKKE